MNLKEAFLAPDMVYALALYNQWMNRKLYLHASKLPESQYKENRKAFFGSIHATLNHIMVADFIWLGRLSKQYPYAALDLVNENITSLNQELHSNLAAMRSRREDLDQIIIDLSKEMTSEHLRQMLVYTTTDKKKCKSPLSLVMLHMFNHQTHHRGQITTLFSQFGVDVGVTDFIAFTREVTS